MKDKNSNISISISKNKDIVTVPDETYTQLIILELIKNQITNISTAKKLLYNDLKRISKYLNKTIFDNECTIWNGYLINTNKYSYINFYFNGKKHALHRLLFINYIGELDDSEYIKFNCENKGKCCNVNHFYKIYKNEILSNDANVNKPTNQNKNKEIINNNIVGFDL